MRYSLERKCYVQAVPENFQDTLKSLAGFVTCSAVTGLGFGIIHSMNITEFSLESDERLIPTITAFGAVYYAKKVYDNFKKDRARVHQLALEIDKERERRKKEREKAMEGFITPDQLSQLQTQKLFDQDERVVELKKYRDILTSAQEEQKSGATAGKRKSLNNGIYKANDNY